ncbi:MAG: hypothetical protein LBL60_02930 [Mycoplasmataceae bacterium]|jgi:hypothetical protein|nr:hypothetical protein [Mycoplasmataceae bacterium]
MKKHNEFKQVKLEIEQIMDSYRVNRFKLDHIDNPIINNRDNNEYVDKCKEYINTVDAVLKHMEQEDKKIIDHIYIKKLSIDSLNYSIATFYSKCKKAFKAFLRYFK